MLVSRRMNPARVVRVGHVQRGSFFSEKCIMHSRSRQSCEFLRVSVGFLHERRVTLTIV